jgi:hypothetical protein
MRSTASILLFLGVACGLLHGSTITVSLTTAGLPAGNYLLDFQFINGDHVAGNNSATILDFSSANLTLGALSIFGPVTGSGLVSGVVLTDGPTTEVDQAFTAGATAGTLSFMVNYTSNYAAPGPGDAFTFAITDTSLNSTRSSGNGAELEIDMTGANPAVSTFPADVGFQPAVQGNTPEPATVIGAALGMLLMGRFRRRCLLTRA